ncbi:unnamed protein product [Plutella xylostella]|uniref:(diamondback moth) hypothetical protein n=1 Tax=Plutella xylostella TaxID=51655 RepID=A0A8S4ECB3_PLUXY|nr:unnamed protein product [Plutella xylostella]
MAPSTVTETEVQTTTDNSAFAARETKTWEIVYRRERDYDQETVERKYNYDVMLPKNDPKFLKPIRRWERDVMGFLTPLRWKNILAITTYHLVGIVWFLHYLSRGMLPKLQTILFCWVMGWLGGFGVTGGAHRYWTHRAYKATLPLQVVLMLCYSVSGQNTIFEWVRDHRVHHKFSETSADPHDANRGFFFSHVGWLMMKKHPEVIRQGSKVDMSDIVNDPLVRFHTRYFQVFKLLLCFVLPSLVPRLWGEGWGYCVLAQAVLRHLLNLHFTWSVNSFAHLWGNKPYDKSIMPSENWGVSVVAMGEGWHNYHHTFPWDYKAAELAYDLNPTTYFIDLFAKIGWAYDLKKASPCLINAVALRKGDLNYKKH